MLQEHSFFSRPLIYFGPIQSIDMDDEEEEWDLSMPEAFFGEDQSQNQKMQAGLILNWFDDQRI